MNLEMKVGAFVFASIAIVLATMYCVSGLEFGDTRVPYKTYLRQAGGLAPGTEVLFGGITVGKVTTVKPDPMDPTRIEIAFDVKQGTQLNAKSVAKLGSVSLMSRAVLSISTGSNDAPRLPAGAVLASEESLSLDDLQRRIVTVAESAQTLIASVQMDLGGISGDAHQLLSNLNNVTGQSNRKRIANILVNADTLVAEMSPRIDRINDQVMKLARNANGLADRMGPVIDNVNAAVSNANQTITGVREPLQADLDELQKTIAAAHSLISNLQRVVRTNDQNIAYTLENVRIATENLSDLTQSVKERPWSLIRIKQPEDRKVPQKGAVGK
jgi:phospholipid/cholesterol/gamma-HCH transport system substrate-binding protein